MTVRALILPILYFLLILHPNTLASKNHIIEDEGHHEVRFGKEKALLEINEQKGFKLSPEAIDIFSIKTQAIDIKKPMIPKTSYVSIKEKKGFYLLRDGFFYFLEIDSKANLLPDDRVVTSGMGIIAITDVYTKDESEYGHSH